MQIATNVATRWHHFQWLKIRISGGATCVAILPRIALLLASSISIELVFSSARVTSVKSVNHQWRTDRQTSGLQVNLDPIRIFATIFYLILWCFYPMRISVSYPEIRLNNGLAQIKGLMRGFTRWRLPREEPSKIFAKFENILLLILFLLVGNILC